MDKLPNKTVLCSISTKGRYDTTLHSCLSAVVNQRLLPNKIIIFDDNEEKKRVDLRTLDHYTALFMAMDMKGIEWEVIFGEGKGQHYNHQMANKMDYRWVWRVDDDCIPEANVLYNLMLHADDDVGCIGGSVLTPVYDDLPVHDNSGASCKLKDIYSKPNKQWFVIKEVEEVDHLHCSFVYRSNVADYNLSLSRVAHTEETQFSLLVKARGYRNLIVPGAITWHLKSAGGIRSDDSRAQFARDNEIFGTVTGYKYLIVMNNGIGDHLVLSSILPEIIEKHGMVTIASCYPEVFEDFNVRQISIAESQAMLGCIDEFNIYKKMIDWGWKNSLQNAFRKLYQ